MRRRVGWVSVCALIFLCGCTGSEFLLAEMNIPHSIERPFVWTGKG